MKINKEWCDKHKYILIVDDTNKEFITKVHEYITYVYKCSMRIFNNTWIIKTNNPLDLNSFSKSLGCLDIKKHEFLMVEVGKTMATTTPEFTVKWLCYKYKEANLINKSK